MIKLIKPNRYETGFTHCRKEEFLLDTIDDLNHLPKDCIAGSVAYLADMSKKYMLNPSKEWIEQLTEEIAEISWDDLKDKPFGEELITLVDCEINATHSSWYGYSDTLLKPGYSRPAPDEEVVEDIWLMPGDLVAGQTYIVTYDGVVYEMVAYDDSRDPSLPHVSLGNYENGSVGEPFYLGPGIEPDVSYRLCIPKALDGVTEKKHTVKIETMGVKTLDPKFLPELVVNFTLNDSGCSADKTFAEIEEAVISGRHVRGMFRKSSDTVLIPFTYTPCQFVGYYSGDMQMMFFESTSCVGMNGSGLLSVMVVLNDSNMIDVKVKGFTLTAVE